MGIPQRASTIIRLPPSASVPASWPSRSDTRAGNARVRHKLIEGAWTYRLQARPGERKLYILKDQPAEIQDIAWKGQSRLTA